MAKTLFYKLGLMASVFYDPKNKLKITQGVPGKTNEKTRDTQHAERNGHIIPISEGEYNEMLDELPEATKEAILKEQSSYKPKPIGKTKKDISSEEGEGDDENDDERKELFEKLSGFEISNKEMKRLKALPTDELKEYVDGLD